MCISIINIIFVIPLWSLACRGEWQRNGFPRANFDWYWRDCGASDNGWSSPTGNEVSCEYISHALEFYLPTTTTCQLIWEGSMFIKWLFECYYMIKSPALEELVNVIKSTKHYLRWRDTRIYKTLYALREADFISPQNVLICILFWGGKRVENLRWLKILFYFFQWAKTFNSINDFSRWNIMSLAWLLAQKNPCHWLIYLTSRCWNWFRCWDSDLTLFSALVFNILRATWPLSWHVLSTSQKTMRLTNLYKSLNTLARKFDFWHAQHNFWYFSSFRLSLYLN